MEYCSEEEERARMKRNPLSAIIAGIGMAIRAAASATAAAASRAAVAAVGAATRVAPRFVGAARPAASNLVRSASSNPLPAATTVTRTSSMQTLNSAASRLSLLSGQGATTTGRLTGLSGHSVSSSIIPPPASFASVPHVSLASASPSSTLKVMSFIKTYSTKIVGYAVMGGAFTAGAYGVQSIIEAGKGAKADNSSLTRETTFNNTRDIITNSNTLHHNTSTFITHESDRLFNDTSLLIKQNTELLFQATEAMTAEAMANMTNHFNNELEQKMVHLRNQIAEDMTILDEMNDEEIKFIVKREVLNQIQFLLDERKNDLAYEEGVFKTRLNETNMRQKRTIKSKFDLLKERRKMKRSSQEEANFVTFLSKTGILQMMNNIAKLSGRESVLIDNEELTKEVMFLLETTLDSNTIERVLQMQVKELNAYVMSLRKTLTIALFYTVQDRYMDEQELIEREKELISATLDMMQKEREKIVALEEEKREMERSWKKKCQELLLAKKEAEHKQREKEVEAEELANLQQKQKEKEVEQREREDLLKMKEEIELLNVYLNELEKNREYFKKNVRNIVSNGTKCTPDVFVTSFFCVFVYCLS